MTDVVQPDKKTRDKAIKGLTAFLSQSGEDETTAGKVLSKSEMAKLWKGIFYCAFVTFRSGLLQTKSYFLGLSYRLLDVGQASRATSSSNRDI